MIPVSCKEKMNHTDSDGITWYFIPKYGAIEREFIQMTGEISDKPLLEQFTISDAFIDKILVGWDDPQNRMKKYSGNPSALLSQNEKTEILKMWIDANCLTAEEKKS